MFKARTLVSRMNGNQPEACFQCFTFDEQQLLQEGGFVVIVPLQGGTGSMTSPMIVNDVTNNRYDDNVPLHRHMVDPTVPPHPQRQLRTRLRLSIQSLGLNPDTENIPIRLAGVRGTNPKLNPGASCNGKTAGMAFLLSLE